MEHHHRGILFVHGIGEQPEGATVRDFGEPLVAWVREWLARTPGLGVRGDIAVIEAKLTPSKDRNDAPPHCVARVRYTADGMPVEQTWLLAESWWGGDVQPPAFGTFAGWLLTIGAWTIVSHVSKPRGDIRNKYLRTVADVARVALGVMLAILFQVLVLVVAVLALLPLPAVRSTLTGFLLKITGVLGDAYVLVESEVQRAVLINRTRDALKWIAAHSDQVTVIAHSQGAAIAHHALREPEPANVSTLLTYGSGIGKLEELSRSHGGADRVKRVARLAPLSVAILASLIYVAFVEERSNVTSVSALTLGMFLLLTFVLLCVTTSSHWAKLGDRLARLSLKSVRPNLSWVDVYSSHDPVSNGPLAPHGSAIADLRSGDVVNVRSILFDHTSYWRNQIEFLPIVASAIDPSLFTKDDDHGLARAASAHRDNARLLSITRLTTLLAVELLLWIHWDWFVVEGRQLAYAMHGAPEFVQGFAKAVGSATTFVLGSILGDANERAAFAMLGAALSLAAIVAWRYAYVRVWRWWDRLALRRVLTPGLHEAPFDRHAIDLTVAAAGLAPLMIIAGLPYLSALRFGQIVAAAFYVAQLVLLTMATYFVGRSIKALPPKTADDYPAKRKELLEQVAGMGSFVLISLFAVGQFAPKAAFMREAAMGVLYLFFAFSTSRKLARSVDKLAHDVTTTSWGPRVAKLVPAGFAVAITAARMATGSIGTSPSAPQRAGELGLQLVSMYWLGLGVSWLVLRLMSRIRASSVSRPSRA